MASKVLVAEDDPKLAEVVRRYLEREGHRVLLVSNGGDALDAVDVHQPDLLVLDLMLPGVDGWEVCRRLRSTSDVPILVLTARSSEQDVVYGLDLGADDYMSKPFSPPELMARVRTLLRRARPGSAAAGTVLRAGPLCVDVEQHRVLLGGHEIACTPAEFRLLEVLVEHPGRVYSRSQLLDHLHGMASFITQRTVDGHVKNLRKKIEANPAQPELLVTVYGIGYKLDAP